MLLSVKSHVKSNPAETVDKNKRYNRKQLTTKGLYFIQTRNGSVVEISVLIAASTSILKQFFLTLKVTGFWDTVLHSLVEVE